jgi:hypothetical protein
MESDRWVDMKWNVALVGDLQDAEIGETFQIGAQETGQVVPLQISEH